MSNTYLPYLAGQESISITATGNLFGRNLFVKQTYKIYCPTDDTYIQLKDKHVKYKPKKLIATIKLNLFHTPQPSEDENT